MTDTSTCPNCESERGSEYQYGGRLEVNYVCGSWENETRISRSRACDLIASLRAELRSSKADQLASLDEILNLRASLSALHELNERLRAECFRLRSERDDARNDAEAAKMIASGDVEDLRAELDAMRPVVQAAEAWTIDQFPYLESLRDGTPDHALAKAVDEYRNAHTGSEQRSHDTVPHEPMTTDEVFTKYLPEATHDTEAEHD